jgi:hypothetical protein
VVQHNRTVDRAYLEHILTVPDKSTWSS